MSRLEQLQKLADAQPADPFARYGVGLECAQLERWEEALEAFERTLALDRKYVAAYYQKAQAELKLGRRAESTATLKAGIAVATERDEMHAVSEMKKMIEALQ